MNRGSRQSGFTIVELLIVIVVIGILAAISIVAYNGIQTRARTTAATAAARQAAEAIVLYMVENPGAPADLSTVGISNTGDTSYQYRAGGASPSSWCLTATVGNRSVYVSDTQSTPIAGACSGHGANGVPSITNLAVNPSFEGDGGVPPVGSLPRDDRGYRLEYSTAKTHSGSRSLAISAPATEADVYVENSNYIDIPAGTYQMSIWVYLTGSGSTLGDRNVWFACNTCGVINAKYDKTKLNQWQRLSTTVTATAPTKVWVRLYGPTGSTTYFDDLMITSGSTLYPYADGTSPNWSWNGAPASSSSSGPAL